MNAQTRSHFSDPHWPIGQWAGPHWLASTETLDASAPRLPLGAGFVSAAVFQGVFETRVEGAAVFAARLALDASWDAPR